MDERIFCNADLWRLWTWMLMKANHSDKTWCPINKGAGEMEVEVEKGQFLFGRNSAAAELKANPSTIWKRIKKLENLGFCNIQSNSNFSLITICNYNEMTESAKEKEQVKGEERNKIRNDAGEEKDTTKELKELKECKELKEKKHKHGEFKNVILSESEHEKLFIKFNGTAQEKIETLSEYLARVGAKYKSHYLTILKWAKNDSINGKQETTLLEELRKLEGNDET